MKLIYIRSTMEPKNYSTIRSILKKEQGEKIAPYILIIIYIEFVCTRDSPIYLITKFSADHKRIINYM